MLGSVTPNCLIIERNCSFFSYKLLFMVNSGETMFSDLKNMYNLSPLYGETNSLHSFFIIGALSIGASLINPAFF